MDHTGKGQFGEASDCHWILAQPLLKIVLVRPGCPLRDLPSDRHSDLCPVSPNLQRRWLHPLSAFLQSKVLPPAGSQCGPERAGDARHRQAPTDQALSTADQRQSIERFNRTMLEEWAYVRPYASEAERREAFAHFLHIYNLHRSHTALGGEPRSAESTTWLGITTSHDD